MAKIKEALVTGLPLPQLSSSLPSEQSALLSHLQVWGTHWPSPQSNSDTSQEGALSRLAGLKSHNSWISSRPSLQSMCPSHNRRLCRQRSAGPQEKRPAAQLGQECSSLPSPQSSTPLHDKREGRHRLLLRQENSSFLQPSWPVRNPGQYS